MRFSYCLKRICRCQMGPFEKLREKSLSIYEPYGGEGLSRTKCFDYLALLLWIAFKYRSLIVDRSLFLFGMGRSGWCYLVRTRNEWPTERKGARRNKSNRIAWCPDNNRISRALWASCKWFKIIVIIGSFASVRPPLGPYTKCVPHFGPLNNPRRK